MGCCGQGRAALLAKQAIAPTRSFSEAAAGTVPPHPLPPPAVAASPVPAPPTDARHASGNEVRLRYLEHSPIVVQGAVSGRHYPFSATQPVRQVDARDAPFLLRSAFFQPA